MGADANSLNCTKVAHIPITLQHTTITWPMYVIENLQPQVLAGMDLLRALGANIDAIKGSITFAADTAPILLVAHLQPGDHLAHAGPDTQAPRANQPSPAAAARTERPAATANASAATQAAASPAAQTQH